MPQPRGVRKPEHVFDRIIDVYVKYAPEGTWTCDNLPPLSYMVEDELAGIDLEAWMSLKTHARQYLEEGDALSVVEAPHRA